MSRHPKHLTQFLNADIISLSRSHLIMSIAGTTHSSTDIKLSATGPVVYMSGLTRYDGVPGPAVGRDGMKKLTFVYIWWWDLRHDGVPGPSVGLDGMKKLTFVYIWWWDLRYDVVPGPAVGRDGMKKLTFVYIWWWELNPWRADFFIKTKGFFLFEIIIKVLVRFFWFIWIPMLWVYCH